MIVFPRKTSRFFPLFLVIVIHLSLLSSLEFTPWPELHLWPYLMEKGSRLYQNIAFEKPPLLPFLLFFWFKIFGNTLFSLKLITWTTLIISDFLIYYTAGKIFKFSPLKSLASVSIFMLLSLALDGNGFWFDLLLAPLLLATFLLLESKRYLPAGVFFGLILLTKQNSIFLLFPVLLTMVSRQKNIDLVRLKSFLAGALLPVSGLAVYLLISGLLSSFIYWTVIFGGHIGVASLQLPQPKTMALLAILISPLLFSLSFYRLPAIWGLISILFIFPRFEYFHLLPAIPFIALLLPALHPRKKLYLLLVSLILITFSFRQINRRLFVPDRFYEDSTIALGSWIKTHTNPSEKIYLLNTWDHIYTLSNTLPVTDPWFPYLPWYLDRPTIEAEIVSDLKSGNPRLVVSEALSDLPRNQIENYVMSAYRPRLTLNNRFTIWEPK